MTAEEIKRYKKPAFKGYVDSMDKLYYQMLRRWVRKELKKTREFVMVNALVFVLAIAISFLVNFRTDKRKK